MPGSRLHRAVVLSCLGHGLLLTGGAEARKAAPAQVELLHNTPSIVAVSSAVANATDRPHHLVDGKLDTSWNGKTGDLKAWVAFRLPKEAQVRAIKLTVGYTKGDYFAQNHRVTKVRVSRDGKALTEATLDPEKRELQTISVSGGGGDWKLEVLETLPGSKKKWKEICISELEVWGTMPSATKRHKPIVRVGALDGKGKTLPTRLVDADPGARVASAEEFCEQFREEHKNDCTPQTDDPDDMTCVDASAPGECDPLGVSLDAPSGPWEDVTLFESLADPTYGASSCNVAVTYKGDVYVWSDVDVCSGAPGASGRDARTRTNVSIALENVVKGGAKEVVLRWTIEDREEGDSDNLMVCGVGHTKKPSCTSAIMIGVGQKVRFPGDGSIEVSKIESLVLSFP